MIVNLTMGWALFGRSGRESGWAAFGLGGLGHRAPASLPAITFTHATPIAWGRCPLARRKGSLTLGRDGIPGLPTRRSSVPCRPGDPPPSRPPLRLTPPGLADGQGFRSGASLL